jgi:TDG/mug DNA glycosylase family protein
MTDSPLEHCFPPVVARDSKLLILGSLPGAASLAAGRYYAHPRNQFWRLLENVIGEELGTLPYADRLSTLRRRGVGLWDTVGAAHRPGSLDANIRLAEASDIAQLTSALPELRAVAFNGGTAARIGRRNLPAAPPFALIDLPSSSPAYTLPFAAKAEAWRHIRRFTAG